MSVSEYSIPVSLGERSYTIEIACGLIESGRAAQVIAAKANGGRICLVTHPGLKAHYAEPIAAGLISGGRTPAIVTIPAGERAKTLRAVARLYDAFLEARLDRKSLIIAVGGGVLGDIVGFAAATYLRGVRFLQVPTTLLAQVDASVGGKTGVDLPQGKNLVGAFHQPVAVLIDPYTLRTLPGRELRAGMAEVIKYGIIYDNAFFECLVQEMSALIRRDESRLAKVIARSCEIKAEVVAQDETEQGVRAILNFGHTIGHALEAVTEYRRYKHGEAISIGMVVESRIGELLGRTPHDVTERVRAALREAHLPVDFPDDVDIEAILEASQRDKKTVAGAMRFVMPQRVGAVEVHSADVDVVRAAIQQLQRRS